MGLMLLVLGAGAILIFQWVRDIPTETLSSASLTATVSDEAGVDTSSTFLLSFSEQVSSVSARRVLKVEPEIELGVHQGTSKDDILLVPVQPLAAGTIYTFTLGNEEVSYAWTFQTRCDPCVAEVRPFDQETDVSLASSLEIVLDQMLTVDLTQVADAVTISPAVEGSFCQEGRILRFTPDRYWSPGTVYTVEIPSDLTFSQSSVTLAEDVSVSFETARGEPEPTWSIQGAYAYAGGEIPQFTLEVENPLPESTEALVQLYQFDEEEEYAQLLQDVLFSCPSWSQSFQYLQDCDLNGTQLRSTMSMVLQPRAGGYTLSWPTAPPAGYYLLRVTYEGQSRDLLFVVSDISVYSLSDSEKVLLWLHDVSDGSTLAGTVTLWGDSSLVNVDSDGLARFTLAKESGVFVVASGEKTLVLPLWKRNGELRDASNWRYLYLDQQRYENGDSISFWGLVQPRDGSALEYERVSVYFFAADGDAVCREYADLENNLFSGTMALPELLDGLYTLEIWQSGVSLVSRAFYVGDAPEEAIPQQEAEAERSLQLDTDSGYMPGESFAAVFSRGTGTYLFVEAEAGIKSVSVGDNSLYLGTFSPENALNRYLLGVYWDGSRYSASAPTLLRRDYRDAALQIALEADSFYRAGEAASFSLTVTDRDGMPVRGAQVAVTLAVGTAEPEVDPLVGIYEDDQESGLTDGAQKETFPWDGESVFFAVYTTDENGRVEGELDVSKAGGTCYLLAQAIRSQGQIQAGSAYQSLRILGQAAAMEDGQAAALGYTLSVDGAGQTIPGTNGEEVAIVASEEHLQAMSLLLDILCGEDASPVSALAACAAEQLLVEENGDLFAAMLGTRREASAFQLENGALVDENGQADVFLSAKGAVLDIPGISSFALSQYFEDVLASHASRLEWIAALVGEAACGETVLNDLKIFLTAEDLSTEERLWLIWGLYLSGDRQTADLLFSAVKEEDICPDCLALLGILFAEQKERNAALAAFSSAQGESPGDVNFDLEQVVLGYLLLASAQQTPLAFSYSIDNTPYNASLAESGNFILPLHDFSGTLQFESLPEGCGCCHVYVK